MEKCRSLPAKENLANMVDIPAYSLTIILLFPTVYFLISYGCSIVADRLLPFFLHVFILFFESLIIKDNPYICI